MSTEHKDGGPRPEELEAYENAETVLMEQESAEQAATREKQEQFVDALEENPEMTEAAQEDVATAVNEQVMTEDQRAALAEVAEGLASTQALLESGADVDSQTMIENILKERYDVTLQEVLTAFKPTKLEYINPYVAVPQEAAVWGVAKAFGIEIQDMPLKKKAEVRWKLGGDVLKVLGLAMRFIPAVQAGAAPVGMAGEVVGRMGKSMEKVNADPKATNYDVARELTLATLPRDEKGAIDMDATKGMIAEVGGLMVGQEVGDEDVDYLLQEIGGSLAEDPDSLIEALKNFDVIVQEQKAA